MPISWMATGTMLTGIGSVVSAFAIGAAALVGRSTLKDLKATKSVVRKFELAEEISEEAQLVVQQTNLALWFFKIHFGKDEEYDDAPRLIVDITKELDHETILKTLLENLELIENHRKRMIGLKPLAEIHFDAETAATIDALAKNSMVVSYAVTMMANPTTSDHDGASIKDLLLQSSTSQLIEDAARKLKSRLSPHLKS